MNNCRMGDLTDSSGWLTDWTAKCRYHWFYCWRQSKTHVSAIATDFISYLLLTIWLADWVASWLIGLLTQSINNWFADWPINWLTDCLNELITDSQLPDRFNESMANWLKGWLLVCWLTAILIDWSNDWVCYWIHHDEFTLFHFGGNLVSFHQQLPICIYI